MNQHQDYDKIFKENVNKIGNSILSKICGLTNLQFEDADTTLPKTIERRVDFLKIGIDLKMLTKQIYHGEFQADIHPKMEKRELLYYALLYDKYELPIVQYVIYLGERQWNTPTKIEHPHLTFEYKVIAINQIDYETFINSDMPEEIILTILANFKGEHKSKVVQKIINCLKNNTKGKKKLQKYIMQLEILSNLRNLQPEITKQLSNMLLNYDVRKDLRYLQGVEESTKKIIIKLLAKGILSLQEIADVAEVTIDDVILIKNEMI